MVSRIVSWAQKAAAIVFLIRRERRGLLATQDAVASNLEYNAEASRRYHDNGSIQTTMEMVDIDAWKTHGRELHVISKVDPQLWTDLSGAYQSLALTKSRGAVPLTPQHLQDLANRLREQKL